MALKCTALCQLLITTDSNEIEMHIKQHVIITHTHIYTRTRESCLKNANGKSAIIDRSMNANRLHLVEEHCRKAALILLQIDNKSLVSYTSI